MDKKLTLSLNQRVIEKAKRYAESHDTSLSRMIESYFETLTNKEETDQIGITALVESLSGVIELPVDFNYKKSRTKYLLEKHQ